MIPNVNEIVRSVVGAGLLLRNDPRGMEAFDLSLDGLLRSFFAALIVLPGFLLVQWLQTRDVDADAAPTSLLLLAYGARWIVFALTAAVLAKLMGRGTRFVPYVVAGNWSSVVQMGIFLPVVLIGTLLPVPLAGLLLLATMIGLLIYDYLVVRIAFEAEGLEGTAVVLVQLLVGLFVQRLLISG